MPNATNVAPEGDATFVQGEKLELGVRSPLAHHSDLLARVRAESPLHEAVEELPYLVAPLSLRRM